MKSIFINLNRHGAIHVIAWFTLVVGFALFFSSCASVHCDAYGDSNTTSCEEEA